MTPEELRKLSGLEPPVVDRNNRAVEFKLNCRHCGARLDVGGLEVMSRINCPVCQEELIVPQYFAGMFLTGIADGALDNIVCYGYDPVLQRDVAVKTSQGPSQSLGGVRLLDGVRTLGVINHPGVMPILDGGEWNGRSYCVMPKMEQGTLADVLKLPVDFRFTKRQCVQLMEQLSAALTAAEKKGFGHYDLCPRNVFINAEWLGFVSNFRRTDEYEDFRDDPAGLIRFDNWRYFGPELLSGKGPSIAGDVFSFGMLLYVLLGNRYPFGIVNTVAELLDCERRFPVNYECLKESPAYTPELAAMIRRMLQFDPALRPPHHEIHYLMERQLEAVL